MAQQRNFWMRWRVRVGYPVAVIYWLLAAPTARSIAAGAIVAAVGLIIRAAASGHLRKYEQLCTSGPYARTRNPLYFGSAFLAAGFAVAGHSWLAGALVTAYFAIFYYAVMRNEESDLRTRYGAAFDQYAAQTPLFFPSLAISRASPTPAVESAAGHPPSVDIASTPANFALSRQSEFSWRQYARNREYQALIGTIAGLAVVCLRMWLRSRWGY